MHLVGHAPLTSISMHKEAIVFRTHHTSRSVMDYFVKRAAAQCGDLVRTMTMTTVADVDAMRSDLEAAFKSAKVAYD